MHTRQINRLRRDLARRPALARAAADALAADASPPALRALLDAILHSGESLARESALLALRRQADWRCVNAVCAAWAMTRHPELAAILVERGWAANDPPTLRVLSALAAGRADLLEQGRASVVAPLVRACDDHDRVLAGRARATLIRLQRPEAQEALCRLAVECDNPVAREAALVAGFVPHEPQQRALFLFATSQWTDHRAADPDGTLLGAAYAAAGPAVRARVAAQSRRARFVGWASAAAKARPTRRPVDMTDAEWEAVLPSLASRPADAWALAQVAPPTWAKRLISALAAVVWMPEGLGRRRFAELARLAERCTEPPPAPQLVISQEAHTRPIIRIAVSPDGRLLASAAADGSLQLWHLPDLTPLATLPRHPWPVASLAFSPDGQLLMSASAVGALRLWRLADRRAGGMPCQELAGRAPAAFMPDSRTVVSAVASGGVGLWRLPDIRPLGLIGECAGRATRLAVSPDGELLAVVTERRAPRDAAVQLWRLPDGTPAGALNGDEWPVEQLAFGPGGRTLMAAGAGARIWSLSDGMSTPLNGVQAPLAISSHGHLVATASAAGGAVVLRATDGMMVGRADGSATLASLLVTASGRVLAGGEAGGALRLWLLPWMREIDTLTGHTGRLTCFAADTRGPLLVSGGVDGALRLWHLGIADLCRLPPHVLVSADFTRARQLLADPSTLAAERAWLELLLALAAPRGREERLAQISVGAFQIALAETE